jgi:hypothetical protein
VGCVECGITEVLKSLMLVQMSTCFMARLHRGLIVEVTLFFFVIFDLLRPPSILRWFITCTLWTKSRQKPSGILAWYFVNLHIVLSCEFTNFILAHPCQHCRVAVLHGACCNCLSTCSMKWSIVGESYSSDERISCFHLCGHCWVWAWLVI